MVAVLWNVLILTVGNNPYNADKNLFASKATKDRAHKRFRLFVLSKLFLALQEKNIRKSIICDAIHDCVIELEDCSISEQDACNVLNNTNNANNEREYEEAYVVHLDDHGAINNNIDIPTTSWGGYLSTICCCLVVLGLGYAYLRGYFTSVFIPLLVYACVAQSRRTGNDNQSCLQTITRYVTIGLKNALIGVITLIQAYVGLICAFMCFPIFIFTVKALFISMNSGNFISNFEGGTFIMLALNFLVMYCLLWALKCKLV